MRIGILVVLVAFLALACVPREDAPLEPPVAKKVPRELEKHGDVRVDDYYWLRERENPDVVAYLEAENEYTGSVMAHAEAFQESLFDEIVARIKQDDESVPYEKDEIYYYHRYEEGGEYRIYCRKKGSLDAREEVLVDGNELAEGHEFFALRGLRISADHNVLSYAVDTEGRR